MARKLGMRAMALSALGGSMAAVLMAVRTTIGL
jgi:hypothetical protein